MVIKKLVFPYEPSDDYKRYPRRILFAKIIVEKFYYIYNTAFKIDPWPNGDFYFKKEDDNFIDMTDKEQFINSLINLQRLGLINVIDNGIDYTKNPCDFGVHTIIDGDIKAHVASINIVATSYLTDFMETCCSKDTYDQIDTMK